MRKVSTYKMAFMLLAATSLLAGCSGDDFNGNGNVNGNSNNITFNTNVSNFSSKATIYDNSNLESFTCRAFNATTTEEFIEPTTVSWNSVAKKWQFAQNRYWPGASGLDFFAYMPATAPTYISNISYSTARQPQFVCTGLPTTTEGQKDLKEFVCAMAVNKNQENSVPSGVSMQFKHPFAILKFKLDPASSSGVTINWVRIEADEDEGHGIKTGGTCTINGTSSTWSSQAAKDVFTWSSLTGDTYIEAKADESPYLVIPNDYSATKMRISVNATWASSISSKTETKTATLQDVEKDGNKLMHWEAGYSYLFTLKLTDQLDVNTAKYTVEQW